MSSIAPVGALPTALSGLNRATEKANAAAENIASGEVRAEDIVDLKIAETAFKANAAVVRTAAEMDKRLLDLFA
jgi:flagellar basal body rod protein FlgC